MVLQFSGNFLDFMTSLHALRDEILNIISFYIITKKEKKKKGR